MFDITHSTALSPSGSNRCYFRDTLSDGTQLIRVKGTCRAENQAFIYLTRHFAAKGLPVPEIVEVADDEMSYFQTDLGNTLLFDAIAHGRQTGTFSSDEYALLARTIRLLAHIQIDGAEGLDWQMCYPIPALDKRSILWDLNYWKYCFLKTRVETIDEPKLEDEFTHLADCLLRTPYWGFMYRDFQSRNVMVWHDAPYFIDYQGGRRGALLYDLASFLWQAKAHFSSDLRQRLLSEYTDEAATLYQSHGEAFDTTDFLSLLPHFVLFRTLQVLGAYGFRGGFEHKEHFLQSIPFAIENLQQLFVQHPTLQTEFPYLYALSEQLEKPIEQATQFADTESDTESNAEAALLEPQLPLLVTIYSFSFKKGIPEDPSGNGGGYVFDCRSTLNPGKYEQYKTLTGLDQPVIDFLERDGEILTFLSSVYPLVEHHAARFLERGFTHLQICFGCTGGQHRSVYCAEATARYLHEHFDNQVHIHLIHREQHVEKDF